MVGAVNKIGLKYENSGWCILAIYVYLLWFSISQFENLFKIMYLYLQ